MTIDPHKFGLSVIPSGAILFNNKEHFEEVEFHSFFEGTPTHRCFLGTRSGASAVATYATIKHLGFNGYLERTRYYFNIREYLRNLLLSENLDFYLPPDLNIVTLKHPNVKEAVGYFEEHNWIISQSKNYNCLRIVLANHVAEESLESFFQLYQNQLETVSLSCT
ncbi:MAG: hypothetical protein HC831_28465 [Chloroflexia bacterium]|nr:hypothetical protein [Chloroflexia bacterium]